MAFSVQKINPLDRQPRKAVGLKIPFSSPSVFTSNYQTKDAIRVNLINYLLTGRGERYFNLEFGSGIRNLLFEQITETTLEELRFRIEQEILQNFPQLTLNTLLVESQPDTNTVNIYFRYSIQSTDIVDEVLLNLQQ
jgi:phage baseplate assembly protein W